MDIWVHPYAVIRVQVGVSFKDNGVWPSVYDVVVSWLRLQTPIDCIPHPYWIYPKCFSTLLRCCGWAYHGYTLMPEYIVQALIMEISQPISSSCINRRGTTITSRHAAVHSI